MQFSSDKQRKAIFASFRNRFSREGIPGLGDALVGSITRAWPGNGEDKSSIDLDRSNSIQITDMGAKVPHPDIVNKPLNEQFKFAISDKIGEAELYKSMATRVDPKDSIQLNYMAEQEEWNKDALVEMAPRYIGSIAQSTGGLRDNVPSPTSGVVTEDAVDNYKSGFSADPTENDYLASEYFDVDPNTLAERRQSVREGEKISPFVAREQFIKDWKQMVGGDDLHVADEFYDDYLTSDSKSHLDYLKRIGIPTDFDIPSNFIKVEVSGVIPESQLSRVKNMVDTYEVDGGYVFIGSVDNVAKAEEYVR